jgi:hypothetical protein
LGPGDGSGAPQCLRAHLTFHVARFRVHVPHGCKRRTVVARSMRRHRGYRIRGAATESAGHDNDLRKGWLASSLIRRRPFTSPEACDAPSARRSSPHRRRRTRA